MREIKFRGRNIKTGEIHYGHYSEYPVGNGRISHCITDKNLDSWAVEPESVAQLVGYDADGNEVFEGDVIQTSDGKDYLIDDWGLTDRVFVSTGKLKK